ncbi:Cro/CI family transcriptional regulator [Variovorax boronicumulans]
MNAICRAVSAAGGPSRLAQGLGVSTQAVRFWRDGDRAVPEKHGAEIERLCGGAVTRKDLWPESWSRIWPELAQVDPETAEQGQASRMADGEGA